jgi:hypothetical protein
MFSYGHRLPPRLDLCPPAAWVHAEPPVHLILIHRAPHRAIVLRPGSAARELHPLAAGVDADRL